jgi:phage-related protein
MTVTTAMATELQNLHQTDAWVELYTLDCTAIGGAVYRFTPHFSDSGVVYFGGDGYMSLPITSDGWEVSATGTQPRPTLSVSNVAKTLLNAINTLGDIVGAKVTRIRTKVRFLDSATFSRVNLLNYSEDFSQAVWVTTNASVSRSTASVAAGAKTAFKLVEDGTASIAHKVQIGSLAVAVGQQHTVSFYAKAGERSFLSVDAGVTNRYSALQRCDVNLNNGSLSAFSQGTFGFGSTDVGNGWFRYVVSLPPVTAAGNNSITFNLKPSDTNSRVYNGDGTSGCYLTGVQWELGTSVSPYQYTTTSHQPFADSNAFLKPDVYFVEQKTAHTAEIVQWQLVSAIERLGMKLPRRQIFRDATKNSSGFPGVSRYRGYN